MLTRNAPSQVTLLATAGAVALTVVVALYFPERNDGSGALLGGIFSFVAVALGLAVVSSVRSLPTRSGVERVRILAVSLVLGAALGLFNLAANYGIAALDSSVRGQMIEQWANFSAWSVLFSGVILEEIAYRLLLMGGVAWLTLRVTHDRQTVFLVALAVSSLLFGVAHILPGSRPTVGPLHAVAVTVKSAAAGVLLGWVFWRKGLPWSIVCHSTANAVHLFAWPVLF